MGRTVAILRWMRLFLGTRHSAGNVYYHGFFSSKNHVGESASGNRGCLFA